MNPTTTTCRHCHQTIVHFHGRLWHEVGHTIFPQYCRNGTPAGTNQATDGGGNLHEPVPVPGSTNPMQ